MGTGRTIREIGLKSALVPRFPGITSALGCVLADLRQDTVQTLNVMLDGIDAAALERRMQAAGQEVSAVVAAAGVPITKTDVVYELDMHYLGSFDTSGSVTGKHVFDFANAARLRLRKLAAAIRSPETAA
jgi:N-methylhydantoinase A